MSQDYDRIFPYIEASRLDVMYRMKSHDRNMNNEQKDKSLEICKNFGIKPTSILNKGQQNG